MQVVRISARLSGDRGAALAEAAVITPIFFYLIFGIFEYGRVFFTYNSVNNVALTGTRTVAINGAILNADYASLQAMKKPLGVLNTADLLRIVVWHPPAPTAATPSPTIPSGCAGGTPTGHPGPVYTAWAGSTLGWCNVYTPSALVLLPTAFGCTSTSPDRFWCPSVRKNANSGPNAADYVGVYVAYRSRYITGMFGSSIDITSDAMSRIEPQSVS